MTNFILMEMRHRRFAQMTSRCESSTLPFERHAADHTSAEEVIDLKRSIARMIALVERHLEQNNGYARATRLKAAFRSYCAGLMGQSIGTQIRAADTLQTSVCVTNTCETYGVTEDLAFVRHRNRIYQQRHRGRVAAMLAIAELSGMTGWDGELEQAARALDLYRSAKLAPSLKRKNCQTTPPFQHL